MPQLCDIKECTGCAACYASCPHNAISFEKDKYGFSYPVIDKKLCVDCKSCERKCPSLIKLKGNMPYKAIACHISDENERLKSSSGGLATLIARYFIEIGGIVYGCAFLNSTNVKHIRCTTYNDLQKLRESKYVQSSLNSIFALIQKDLKQGHRVLFIGTPCQVAGIKSKYSRYENLYTMDLVCHGVPSLQFFIDTLPKEYIISDNFKYSFRKNISYCISICENGKIVYQRPLYKDIFYKGFFNGLIFRPSCYNCLYAKPERNSDITLGDFWGLKSKLISDIEKGVSLVLINTDKGKSIFDKLGDKIIFEDKTLKEAFENNEQLNHPYGENFRAKLFRKLYNIFGYKIAIWMSLPEKIIGSRIKNFLQTKQCK